MGKKKTADLRSVLAYFSAVKNEIAIDILRYKALNIDPGKYGNLPRPTIWISRLKPYRAFLPLVSFLWRYIFSYLFLFLGYFKFLLQFYKRKEKSILEEYESPIAIGTCVRSIDVIDSLLSDELYYKWLIPDWVDSSQVKDRSRILNLNSLLELKDINKALSLSLLSLKYFSKKIDPVWHIQLYTSFKWYLLHVILLKTNADLITSDHFDRYAVLADTIIQQRGGKNTLTMIQHGFLTDGSDEKNSLYIPTKLNSVSKIYVYDKSSEDFYINNILTNRDKSIEALYYTSKLILSEIDSQDIPVILFVGNAICEGLHVHVLNSLELKYKFKAYYKPHPTEKSGSPVLKQRWEIIKDRQFFPKVNFLIAYPSTLISEYETLGIGSLVHPINLMPEAAQDYLNLVEDELIKHISKKVTN